MSSWAPKLAENVRTARDRCIEQLNGLARQVQGGFDDLRSRAWEFDLDTHPMDCIDAAMTWAEALVRRVILSRVVELRGDNQFIRRLPSTVLNTIHRETGGQMENHQSHTAGSSAGWNPSRAVPTGACADNTAWTPDGSGVVGEHGDMCAQSSETSTPFADHHKPYSPPEPSTKYRPTFRWTEARSVPTVPKGTATGPRPKPRKYDVHTKIEAKLALYRHMLENSEAYAKRLAYRLDTAVGRIKAEPDPTCLPNASVPSDKPDDHPFGELEQISTGSRTTPCPGKLVADNETSSPGFSAAEDQDPDNQNTPSLRKTDTAANEIGQESPDTLYDRKHLRGQVPMLKSGSAAQSQNRFPSARESTVLESNRKTTSSLIPERGELVLNPLYVSEAHKSKKQPSEIQITKPPPILSWTLYSNPPPGGDDLRTDLVAMHMAYEGALSATHRGDDVVTGGQIQNMLNPSGGPLR